MNRNVLKAPAQVETVYAVDPFIPPATGAGRLAFDFSATTFTRPAGMVSLLAVMDRIRRAGDDHKIALMLPQSNAVRTYWRLAGIMDALGEFCDFEGMPEQDALPAPVPVKPMVKCSHFRDESDADRLSVEMEDSFMSALRGYASLANECCETFTELITNAVYHAEGGGGFALAQYCEYQDGPAIEIAVADSGIGIWNSLNKNIELTGIDSDCAAIKLALKEGVTSVGSKYRGFGLCYVAANVQLEPNRRLAIRSGNGIITLLGDGEIREESTEVAYSGTAISVTIPL